jgi:hypothetical protein
MGRLEEIDARDRVDGTPRLQRLRQIPAEVGKFLALLLVNAPDGRVIEIGTSAGYSTLWLALAARASGRTITTFEILPEKVELAQATFAAAGVGDVVTLVHGDAREHLPNTTDIAFCFLDAEKEVYGDCYELVVPDMVSGGSPGRFAADDRPEPGRRTGGCYGGDGGEWAVAGPESLSGDRSAPGLQAGRVCSGHLKHQRHGRRPLCCRSAGD